MLPSVSGKVPVNGMPLPPDGMDGLACPRSTVKGNTLLTASLVDVDRYRWRRTNNRIAMIVKPKSVPMEAATATSVLDLS